jgi:RNA polymerase-binding transcription factor DksA
MQSLRTIGNGSSENDPALCLVLTRSNTNTGGTHEHESIQATTAGTRARVVSSGRTSEVRVREPGDGAAHDVGDESSTDELKAEQFAEADADRIVLHQVRDALKRIDNGTFGTCEVDGEPIEAERLEAMPWAPYCLGHQQIREGTGPPRTPTL